MYSSTAGDYQATTMDVHEKNSRILDLLGALGLFLADYANDPKSGLAWCFSCSFPNKIVKFTHGVGWIGHRNGHVLEIIPEEEFPDLYSPGWLGRTARATYQYTRVKLQPKDLVLAIAKFNGAELEEALSKRKRKEKCGSCAFFRSPACSSPTTRRVWYSGEACQRFWPLSKRLAETKQKEALENLVARAINE